jgi:MYXO-CTERM domain-containing protein
MANDKWCDYYGFLLSCILQFVFRSIFEAKLCKGGKTAMKRYIRSGILALSLSALPLGLSAMAQTGGQGGGYQGYQDRTTTTTTQRATDGGRSDWGWLGLLGLLGLAGLMRRREETTTSTRYRTTGGDYRTGETTGAR